MDWDFDLASFSTIAIAGLLGGLIGFEREFHDKPAGLRTHIFVSAGAALLMLLAEESLDFFVIQSRQDLVRADPIRVIQAIVVGISFLGAGTIVHERGANVEGLTTAASIFFTAGIGIAVAVGKTVLATEATLLALLVLLVIGWIERRFMGSESDR